MKLLIFSDLHGDFKALERLLSTEADAYICAGDLITHRHSLDRMGELLSRRADRVWMLPGNHESHEQIAGLCARHGLNDFHGRTFAAGSYTVAGLGYSNITPFQTPGEYTEDELAERLKPFAGIDPLVLVCHCPPRDTPLDRIREGVHTGSRAIAAFLAAEQPAHFFCGHIHEAEGVAAALGRTRAVNVGKRGYLLELD